MTETGRPPQAGIELSWAHCIPTVSRIDILKVAVACSAAQTRSPKEIIVVDASPDWEAHERELRELLAGTAIRLVVIPAQERSAAFQRNQALDHVTADVVLFTDDDSLLFPDYAERTLAIFERDPDQRIVGVGGNLVADFPPVAARMLGLHDGSNVPAALEQKDTGTRKVARLAGFLEENLKIWPWIRKEILMMSMERMFVPYDEGRPGNADRVAGIMGSDEGYLSDYLPGGSMAIRSPVAKAERFNSYLLGYSPCEDLDVSYRYGRHGACVIIHASRQHHYEVAASRASRYLATLLGVSNVAFFIRVNSADPSRLEGRYWIFVARRLLGETIKDVVARRFEFPQVRGILGAIPLAYRIFRRDRRDVSAWYKEQQRALIAARRR
ncbi:glycosyltransferase family A protein [Sphingomonas humi]|uniref:Glycosyltransferase 2-like domain-containing protein n=1 Tax=Sphingomonas humi TaxID=335630 RepID=A0ABP7RRE2_9SPHN